jgi:Acyl-CoA dehydrogenase, N-terminal domain
MPSPAKDRKPVSLPAPNSDFYELVETLPAEELAIVKQVRTFMETKFAPIITKWVEDAFPFEILPSLKELNIGGIAMQVKRTSPLEKELHGESNKREIVAKRACWNDA